MKAIHALILLMLIYMAKADVEWFREKKCEDFMPDKEPAFGLDFYRSTENYYRLCFVKLKKKIRDYIIVIQYPPVLGFSEK